MRWQDIEEVYISGSVSSVDFLPVGEKRSITVADSSKNRIKITVSGFFRMSEEKKYEFLEIYGYILQNIGDRQWKQFCQRIAQGQRVSFKAFDIARDGIYCVKGTKKIFGFAIGYDKIELPNIIGCDIRNGDFYIQHLRTNGKPNQKWIDYVADIPNIHIARAFIEQIAGQNIEKANV